MPSTVDALIAATRLAAGLPDADAFFDKDGLGDGADLRSLLDQVMHEEVSALLRATRSEYTVKLAPDVQIVVGTTLYEVPERSSLGGLRHVLYVTGDTLRPVPMPHLSREDAYLYQSSEPWQPGWLTPYGFIFRDEQIELVPGPISGTLGTIRMAYYRRFSKAVQSSDVTKAVQITALPAANQATVAAVPAAWIAAVELDVHRPSNLYRVVADDLAIASATPTVITFTANLPDDVQIGDWLSLTGETPVVEVPEGMHGFITWSLAARALNALGDDAGEARAQRKAGGIRASLTTMLTPRADGNRRKVINRSSGLRWTGSW